MIDRRHGLPCRIREAGDSAALVELGSTLHGPDEVIDAHVNARAIGIAAAVRAAAVTGVRDVVPTYRSVAVFFDPLVTDLDALSVTLRQACDAPSRDEVGMMIEVPVAYGGHFGPDLAALAARAGVSADGVIERHSSRTYRVFMLGFLPGFAYMGSVDDAIASPRRATPRLRVPAGSIGIAGRQTGVYPCESPGGWQLIGRTPLVVFDPTRTPAALFAPGDRVRFVPEVRRDPHAFDVGHTVRLKPDTTSEDVTSGDVVSGFSRTDGSPKPDTTSEVDRWITVLLPGFLTTVQDSGRWGHQDRGVTVAGPMDSVAHRTANALVGNPSGAATLEATVMGPELQFDAATVVGIAGADLGATIGGVACAPNTSRQCPAGSVLRFGERRGGARVYLAFDGGVAVPPVLGSRATHVLSGIGGFGGRAITAGDRLALRAAAGTPIDRRVAIPMTVRAGGARLRILPGPQDDFFDPTALDILQRSRFIVSSQSDRMGYRLTGGRPIPRLTDREMISDATFPGGIQIPPSGEPILLMADRQTIGGYPQIAIVISADLPLAGQLAPGDWIELEICSRAEAIAALVAQEGELRALQ